MTTPFKITTAKSYSNGFLLVLERLSYYYYCLFYLYATVNLNCFAIIIPKESIKKKNVKGVNFVAICNMLRQRQRSSYHSAKCVILASTSWCSVSDWRRVTSRRLWRMTRLATRHVTQNYGASKNVWQFCFLFWKAN